MTPFPPHRVLALISPDQGGLLQGESGQRLPILVLQLQADAPGRGGGKVQNQVSTLEDQRTTDPFSSPMVRVDGDELRLNAATDRGGSIRVELADEAGDPLGPEPAIFEGDAGDAVVADLAPWRGQAVRLRFTLDRARLYAFRIAARE